MGLGNILENLVDAVTGRDNNDNAQQQQQPVNNGQYVDNTQYNNQDILPASQDPLGDPADDNLVNTGYDNNDILPASEDPYGDPADAPQQQRGTY